MDINSFNTIKDVEKYRKSVNEECDKRIKTIKSCIVAEKLSNKSFGYIKECFEAISPELFKTKGGMEIISKYSSAIKNSKNLSKLHSIYEAIRKSNKNSVDFVTNYVYNSDFKIDKKNIGNEINNVGRILAEGYLMLSDADKLLPVENLPLYKSVEYIAENTLNFGNANLFGDAVNVIKENVEKNNCTENIFESISIEDFAEDLISDFNEKYNLNTLSEEEISIIKEISETGNKEIVFDKYKKLCEDKLNEAKKAFLNEGNKDGVNKIESILSKLSLKEYSNDTVTSDIINIIELTNILG